MRTSIRLFVVVAALGLSAASTGSNQQQAQGPATPPPSYGTQNSGPAAPQPMAIKGALGLVELVFGAVKMERHPDSPDTLRGVWLYERNGQEVVGYFAGSLSGNTFSFSWEEPTSGGPPLVGGGYLVFDTTGKAFQGKWWTTNRDRGGDWSGWRAEGSTGAVPDSGPAEPAPDSAPIDDGPNDLPPTPAPAGDDDFI